MSVLGEPRFQAWVAAARTGGGFGGNLTVVDKVPPDLLPLVDNHWYQYPPLNPMWHSILGLVIALFGLLGFCGNAMVIYIFSCTKSLRTPSNLFVVNLAFSDFLMMTALCPMMAINCYYETWVLGKYILIIPHLISTHICLQGLLCANCTACLDHFSGAHPSGP